MALTPFALLATPARGGFGRVCGEQGLLLGTSVRHIVSTAVAHSGLDDAARADICAANLHTVAVANRFYVKNAQDLHRTARAGRAGDFERGLGQSASLSSSESFPCCHAHFVCSVYSFFTPQFRAEFGVLIDYRSCLHPELRVTAILSESVREEPRVLSSSSLRICSQCTKSFQKTPSHQGTRCWSCKKSKSPKVVNEQF